MSAAPSAGRRSCHIVRATTAGLSIPSWPCKSSRKASSDGQHSGRTSVRAAVDVMGGDKAPAAILKGCFEAAALLDGDDLIYLVGDEQVCTAGLSESGLTSEHKKRYQIIPTTQVVEMDDSPVEAIRGKPDSSIAVM